MGFMQNRFHFRTRLHRWLRDVDTNAVTIAGQGYKSALPVVRFGEAVKHLGFVGDTNTMLLELGDKLK
jgi:nicotinamide riboside kinase